MSCCGGKNAWHVRGILAMHKFRFACGVARQLFPCRLLTLRVVKHAGLPIGGGWSECLTFFRADDAGARAVSSTRVANMFAPAAAVGRTPRADMRCPGVGTQRHDCSGSRWQP